MASGGDMAFGDQEMDNVDHDMVGYTRIHIYIHTYIHNGIE